MPVTTVALLAIAAALTFSAVRYYVLERQHIDFRIFYNEGGAWLRGEPLYAGAQALNLNPPSLTVLVFGPLARTPYAIAHGLWLVLSVVAVIASLRAIARALQVPAPRLALAAALLFLIHGSQQSWAIGQLTWPLLLYPTTRAWLAFRDRRPYHAGAWLAPAIVAKPPLALLAVLLPVPVWLTAGVISAAVSGATLMVTGLEPWRGWLHAGAAVDWLTKPFNASLWGLAARWQAGANLPMAMADLRPLWIVLVLGAGALLAWHAAQQRDRDRRFYCATLWSVLMSPLGWGYYLPLVAGPAIAIWPTSAWTWIAWAFALAPVGGNPPGLGLLPSSAFFLAVACAWWAGTRDSSPMHARR